MAQRKINNSLFFSNLQEIENITLKIIKLGRKKVFFWLNR